MARMFRLGHGAGPWCWASYTQNNASPKNKKEKKVGSGEKSGTSELSLISLNPIRGYVVFILVSLRREMWLCCFHFFF